MEPDPQPNPRIPDTTDQTLPYMVVVFHDRTREDRYHPTVEDAIEDAFILRRDSGNHVEGVFGPDGDKIKVPWVRGQ